MKILVLVCEDNSLKNLFEVYDKYAKEIVKLDDFQQFNLIKEFRKHKAYIEQWIGENIKKYSYDVYDDSYYEANISNVTVMNLLMNGLYTEEEMKEIIQKNRQFISNELQDKYIECGKKARNGKYIFAWNIGEEKLNEILKN